MKVVVQIVLLVFFLLLALFVFVPSSEVLSDAADSPAMPPLPPPPMPPAELNENSLQVYTKLVAAYEQSATAYEAFARVAGKSNRQAAFEMVVNKTLGDLFGKLMLGLLGFAFVKTGSTVLNNAVLLRSNKEPEKLSLF